MCQPKRKSCGFDLESAMNLAECISDSTDRFYVSMRSCEITRNWTIVILSESVQHDGRTEAWQFCDSVRLYRWCRDTLNIPETLAVIWHPGSRNHAEMFPA